ncbi:hypothetical protein [Microvirga puerhi]|uniref:Uncharacterized protein n=1 Tax=Microvirga puerhi TaxID=2876078 RepID=A0ABS7VUI3_9HYPH|nr:hypothetical protein [Microvirga puerhi]MBZ6078834.1 hypothetical protein [Microvirga puerhi]
MLYIGILTTIAALKNQGKTPTMQSVAELSGLGYPNVTRYCKTLFDVGILEKTPINTPSGKGYAYELSFAKTPELYDIVLNHILDTPPGKRR